MPETQEQDSLPGILASIVASKRREVAALRPRIGTLEARLDRVAPPRDFRGALTRPGSVSLIAECKRRSPGAGAIRTGLDPADLTRRYEAAGASAISVLTDVEYFGGSMDDLAAAHDAMALPILRKDFTLDIVQVIEARAGGADAVLLIVRILSDDELARLYVAATALGMSALVEVHDARELERALAVGADLIGINNRDLTTFTTDLGTTVRLLEGVPDDVAIVSESGIRTREDVLPLGEAGVDAILVGETLLRAPDPTEAARDLVDVPSRVRGGG